MKGQELQGKKIPVVSPVDFGIFFPTFIKL
jgi:hypothetical protein